MSEARRDQVLRGVVHRLEDGGRSQAVDVETHPGVVRAGVEVLLPYGLASAPAAGALTVLLAVGGDAGDLVALPAAQPAARMGGLPVGAVALYDDAGSRVLLGADGGITLRAATSIVLQVGGTTLTVTASGVTVQGNLTVQGNIQASGTVSDGVGNLR